MSRIIVGARVRPYTLTTLAGGALAIPQPEGLTHLQFRRFAGCPVCNLHLRSFVKGREALAATHVRTVVMFHSSAEALRGYQADLPLDVVPDPDKRLYLAFGVEAGVRAMLDPRAWAPIVRAVAASLWAIVRGKGDVPPLNPEGGRYGLPADFLINPQGVVVACKYGEHVYDQWSVEEVAALAAGQPVAAPAEAS